METKIQLQTEEVTEDIMRQGYLQYRTGQFLLMYQEAKNQKIIDYLSQPRTFSQIAKQFDFVRALKGLQGVLDSLIWFNIVKRVKSQENETYELIDNYSLPSVDDDLLRIGVGDSGVKSLKQIGAFSKIFSYMTGKNDIGVLFDAENEDLWEQFLEYPYYSFGRDRAVSFISYSGAKILDFGAGLGHGTETIAEIVGKDGRAVAIESSLDFVKTAKVRLASIPQAEVLHLDMQIDLVNELGENAFDGAMFIGAFHYVKDKLACLESLARVIKPGGRLVIGNTCTKNGALDEGMLTFGTAMITPPAFSVPPDELYNYFSMTGFDIEHEYFFGCQGWFFLSLRDG